MCFLNNFFFPSYELTDILTLQENNQQLLVLVFLEIIELGKLLFSLYYPTFGIDKEGFKV
jgi:hypothetical protein